MHDLSPDARLRFLSARCVALTAELKDAHREIVKTKAALENTKADATKYRLQARHAETDQAVAVERATERDRFITDLLQSRLLKGVQV